MTAEKVGVTNQPLSTEPYAIRPQAQPEVAVLGLESHCCQSSRDPDLEVPMDPSLLHKDGQTESQPPLSHSQTGDLDSSLLYGPTEMTSPAYKRRIEIVSDFSDHVKESVSFIDKTTGPLSTISNCLSQETITDLDCLGSVEPLSPSCDLTGCFSLCSEPAPTVFDCHTQDSDISVHNYFGATDSILPLFDKPPHLSHSLTPTPSESLSRPSEAFYVEHESPLSSSLIQDGSTSQLFRAISPISDSLMGQSLTEAISHHSRSVTEDNKAADLFRSLSHLSDSSTEIDTATEPMSDLYIFESGTQDFILNAQNPFLDPQKIKCPDYPSSQPGDKETDLDRDTHVLILSHRDSAEMVTQSHHCSSEEATVDSESELGQHTGLRPPAVAAYEGGLMSISDVSQGKAEVSGLTPQARQSDSPNELWLDACQYLAGEDKGNGDDGMQTILDKSEHSMMEGGVWATSDTSSPPGDTKVSGYPPDESDGIGWSSGDMGGWGPPVERWSSVDSWASALSDWAVIIAAPPEDITTAFAEIGAEIDALTQALAEAETHIDTHTETLDKTDKLTETLEEGQGQEKSQAESEAQAHPQSRNQPPMAIQDKALEPQPIPESSILSGQSCFSSSLTESAELSASPQLHGKSEDAYISTSTVQGDKEPGEIRNTEAERSPCPTDTYSSLGSSCATLASPGGYSVDMTAVALIPGSTSSTVLDEMAADLSHLGGYMEAVETDIYISDKEDAVILNITEDTDEELERQNAPAQLKIEEPLRDGVCKVTEEHSVSQPGLVAKKGGKRSYGPALTVSGFSNSEAETREVDSEGAEGSEPSTDLQFFNTRALTNTHVPGVDTQPGLHTNAPTHVSSDTSQDLDEPGQGEPQREGPRFIMPLAPLSIGSSLFCQTSNTLEGDQVCTKRFLNDNRGHSCAHILPHVLWPTFEGIINKSPLEGDEEKQLIHKKENTINSAEKSSPDEQKVELTVHSDQCLNTGSSSNELYSGDTTECLLSDRNTNTITQEISDLSRELSNLVIIPGDHFLISEKDRIAYITLDLDDPLVSRATKPVETGLRSDPATDQPESDQKKDSKMPHKTHKGTSECKTRSKKDKSAAYHHAAQASKKQENLPHHVPVQQASKIQDIHPLMGGTHTKQDSLAGLEDKGAESVTMIKTIVVTEKVNTKPHGKKKKKTHTQNATAVKSEVEPLVEVEDGAAKGTAKGRIDVFEAKLGAKAGKAKDKPMGFPSNKDSVQSDSAEKKAQQPETKTSQGAEPPHGVDQKDHQPTGSTSRLNDDVIKRRRLSEDKFGKIVSALESKLTKPEVSVRAKREEPKVDVGATRKKAYSEVVKQKTHTPKEEPKVVQPIQAVSVSEDPQSLCLWCQFTAVFTDYTVTWSREGAILAEIKRSAGDESRVSLTISKASNKDLGKYQCRLSSSHGSVTLDYLLTYEVLSEIVIPASPKNIHPAPAEEVVGDEEDVHCSKLMFRDDFLSDQYFGENQPASIIIEKVHFGEGMHRRAFRTKLQAGLVPLLRPGHSCVLKVHNSISYGTKNNDELVQKNFNLAVEECHVQNTAREYIKAYNAVAQSAEAFGDIPEIIPIYLVHRPSSDIPYATLEEELIGDFVKYSVRDGKEINLMRRDSEAGQKCCAFQHWVYHKTDGNLLVTDMQGVGMKLTDVGIATCKKGYKGFRGNCATSFIDQFKALHQCNKYCEILGLTSLQPKPKKPVSAPKPKPQPSAAPKKKTFGPTVKGKS